MITRENVLDAFGLTEQDMVILEPLTQLQEAAKAEEAAYVEWMQSALDEICERYGLESPF